MSKSCECHVESVDVVLTDARLDPGPDRPDDLDLDAPELLALKRDRSASSFAHKWRRGSRHASGYPRRSFLSRDRGNFCGALRHFGHHAIDGRPVLGTVQGAPLRSARADARPSGLDGASAQLRIGNCVMAGK